MAFSPTAQPESGIYPKQWLSVNYSKSTHTKQQPIIQYEQPVSLDKLNLCL